MNAQRRRNDDMENVPAKRKQDVYIRLSDRVPFFGGSEFSANGNLVFLLLMALALAAFGVWHDAKADRFNVMLVSEQALTNCLITLNDAEKREFRERGRYCNRAEWRPLAIIEAEVHK
jgi:hypothetical protein